MVVVAVVVAVLAAVLLPNSGDSQDLRVTRELCQLVLKNSFYLLRFLRCGETFLLFNGVECFGGLYESDFGLWVQDS